YGAVATADGGVVLGLQNDREWRSLCAVVLGDADLADDPRFVTNAARVEHRGELNALIEATLTALDTEAASALLDKAGIANARLNQVREFLDHPVLEARERWRPVDVPGGTIAALRPPADLTGVEPVIG